MSSRDDFSDDTVPIQLNVLILALRQETASDLERELSRIRSLEHSTLFFDPGKPLKENIPNGGRELPDVVILEIDGHHEEVFADVRRFIEGYGAETEVFATFPRSEMAIMPALMRSGFRDVLPLPLNRQDLVMALSNSLARHRKPLNRAIDRRGTVVSFLNTRNGAGGPFLAANLAYCLQYIYKRKVALIDLDIQFGTVAYDFDIRSEGGIVEVLRNPARIDSVFVDALMSRHTSGVHVLASPADLTPWDGLSPRAIARVIAVLVQQYDHVVINLPVLVNDVVERAMALSSPVFLVTQGTISMLRNLNMVMQKLPKHGIPLQNLEVVVNRAGFNDSDVKAVDMKRLIREVPMHRVRSDFKLVMAAENAGRAACELDPRSGLVKDLRALAEHILSLNTDPATASTPTPIRRRWFF